MRTARATAALLLTLAVGACGTTIPSSAPGSLDASRQPTNPGGSTSTLPEFEGRLRDATAREGQLVRSVAAASGGSAADLRLAVLQMRQWVDGEREWLAQHPPAACYAEAAAKYQAALVAMGAAADGFAGIADASVAPSDDVSIPSAGTAAANALQATAQALLDAAALAKVARPGCG